MSQQYDCPNGVTITGEFKEAYAEVLTKEAIEFLAKLHRNFDATRKELINRRVTRQEELDAGKLPDFLPETKAIRESDWVVAPVPQDLQDRRTEITGPTDRKMVINALNAGAKMYMADFEDSCSPTWNNIISGQKNLLDAVSGSISLEDKVKGKMEIENEINE